MGIVKFIELGDWPIKLCLYCFSTSGNLHSNLPRVMTEMNTLFQWSTQHRPISMYQIPNKSFPMQSVGDTEGEGSGMGAHGAARLWCAWLFPEPLVTYFRQTNLTSHAWAETHTGIIGWDEPQLFWWSNLCYWLLIWTFSEPPLLLSTVWGFLVHFSYFLLEHIWLIASASAR